MFSCTYSEAPELYRLAEQIAQLVNWHCHHDMQWLAGVDEWERRLAVSGLLEEMDGALLEQKFLTGV